MERLLGFVSGVLTNGSHRVREPKMLKSTQTAAFGVLSLEKKWPRLFTFMSCRAGCLALFATPFRAPLMRR